MGNLPGFCLSEISLNPLSIECINALYSTTVGEIKEGVEGNLRKWGYQHQADPYFIYMKASSLYIAYQYPFLLLSISILCCCCVRELEQEENNQQRGIQEVNPLATNSTQVLKTTTTTTTTTNLSIRLLPQPCGGTRHITLKESRPKCVHSTTLALTIVVFAS